MHGSLSDLELARLANAGDRDATDAMIERLRCVRPIVAALNARLPRPLATDDVREVVQDALVAIWTKLGTYSGQAGLSAWAYGFCRLELLHAMRRRSRAARSSPLEGDPVDAPAEEPVQDVETVLRALDRIDGRRATVIRMKHFEGLTFQQIGSRLAMPENTAKTLYYRGLEDVLKRFGRSTSEVRP